MATFLTDMMEKGYTQDEVFVVLFEPEKEKKRRQILAIVTKTVDAHRLQKMRELLTYEKLATFRRMNGFDRDVDREDDWRSLPPTPQEYNASLRYELQKLKDAISIATFRRMNGFDRDVDREDDWRSLPPTPQEYIASLRYELQKLKDAISMPRQKVSNLIDEIEEGRIDPERGELESSSAGTGLETPGQQCPPNGGIWETGRTTADNILTAGVGSNQEGSISSPRNAWTR